MSVPEDDDVWARRSRRERERRVMTPLQYRAASSLMTGGVSVKQSRELMFAKHARLESREKLELRGKYNELEKELRESRAREAELEASLRDSRSTLSAVEGELAVLREAEQVQAMANKQMADVLEDERASAFDEQMRKIAIDSSAAEALRLMNEYAAVVERKSADLAVAVERSAATAAGYREQLATVEKERSEEKRDMIASHEAEKLAMREEHALEVQRLEEEMEYLGKICTTMQQVLKKQHRQHQLDSEEKQRMWKLEEQDDSDREFRHHAVNGDGVMPMASSVGKAGIGAATSPDSNALALKNAGERNSARSPGDSMLSTPSCGEADPCSRRAGATVSPLSSIHGGISDSENASVSRKSSRDSPGVDGEVMMSSGGRFMKGRLNEGQSEKMGVNADAPHQDEIECSMCSSHLRAMQTLEREAKRLESEVVMLTHDYTSQSHVCRELENASAALVRDIDDVHAKNSDLERALTNATAASSLRISQVTTLFFQGFASIAIAFFIFWVASAGEDLAPAATVCASEALAIPGSIGGAIPLQDQLQL